MNKNDSPLLRIILLVRCWWIFNHFSNCFAWMFSLLLLCSTVVEISIKGQTEARLTPASKTQREKAAEQRKHNRKFIKYLSKNIMYLMVQNRESEQHGFSAQRIWLMTTHDEVELTQHTQEKTVFSRWNFHDNKKERMKISSNCWTESWIIKKSKFHHFSLCVLLAAVWDRWTEKSAMDLNYAIWLKLIIQRINFCAPQKSFKSTFVFNIFFCEKTSPTPQQFTSIAEIFSWGCKRVSLVLWKTHKTSLLLPRCLLNAKIPRGRIEYFVINYSEGFLMTSFLP